jgi:hypothetical protein
MVGKFLCAAQIKPPVILHQPRLDQRAFKAIEPVAPKGAIESHPVEQGLKEPSGPGAGGQPRADGHDRQRNFADRAPSYCSAATASQRGGANSN